MIYLIFYIFMSNRTPGRGGGGDIIAGKHIKKLEQLNKKTNINI